MVAGVESPFLRIDYNHGMTSFFETGYHPQRL
jgi:hypothetical protein